MRFHGTAAGKPPAVPEVRAPQPAVLVKAGAAGHYSLVKLPDMMDMDRMSLLEALAGTRGFSPDLAGVALQRCTVRVCASASKKAPSAVEGAAVNELEGAETLGDLATPMLTTLPGANLFVRIVLPADSAVVAVAQGELRADGASLAGTRPLARAYNERTTTSSHTPSSLTLLILSRESTILPRLPPPQLLAVLLGPCRSMRTCRSPRTRGPA